MSTSSRASSRPPRAWRRAFTVVELLVAISALTLIVVVLYQIFDQTQKAMRSNSAQVDVSEGGRAAMELIARDLEQMTATSVPGTLDFYVGLPGVPMLQPMIPATTFRTNFLEELFFVSEFNKKLTGIGYRVMPYTNSVGRAFPGTVGMLYRFQYATNEYAVNASSNLLLRTFLTNANLGHPDLFQRVTDGIVHFRVTAYDAWGLPMNEPTALPGRSGLHYATLATNVVMVNATNAVPLTNSITANFVPLGLFKSTGPHGANGNLTFCFFTNVVPPCVEVELGVLEPQVVDRWKSMPNATMASNYLAKQSGKVTLFQQRIPVRTAAPIVPVIIK
jgi:hypothetical protein